MKVVDTESLNLATIRGAGKYDEIIAACGTLKQGQSAQVDVPTGEKGGASGYRNRLSYKIRNVKTPAGTHLRARLTSDQKFVAISLLVGEKPAAKPRKPMTQEQKDALKAKRDAKKKAAEKANAKPAMAKR